MSQKPPEEKGVYRRGLEQVPEGGKSHFADSLSTIDPRHLHARSRIGAIFTMATHSLVGVAIRRERNFTNPQGVNFDMHTLHGRMSFWQFEYEAIAISLDGRGRQEVVDVLKLAAIGSPDETGAIASSVLNEGNKKAVKGEK